MGNLSILPYPYCHVRLVWVIASTISLSNLYIFLLYWIDHFVENSGDYAVGRKNTMRAAMKPAILVVDDDRKTVDLIRLYLEKDGYRVLAAYDGRSAISIARNRRPGLIILDLMLPKVDGLDVCRLLRAESNVPIIMLTAKTTEDDKLRGLDIGADDYVTKPFQHEEVLARVTAHLKISSLRKQLESKNKQLMAVLDEVRQLSCILPICAKCKKPRNDGQYWQLVDKFMNTHEEARFTHSYCPECKHSSGLGDLKRE